MIRKIPQHFINELLVRTNIVDLINQRIQLKKQGQNYQANCPFHNDHNPSFTINKEKQFYHCFGCNSHGNAIDFLMNYEHLNFLETIEELAIIHGLEIPLLSQSKKNLTKHLQKNKIYSLMNQISKIYMNNINTNTGIIALKYLQSRGINAEMLHLFSIGYSTQDTCSTSIYTKNTIGTNINELINSGLIVLDDQKKYYDRFRNRIMFPIKNKYGRITGFGARSLFNTKPKYLNSPETIIFKKRRHLYGLYEVKKTNSKIDKLIVVEGYLDVIILFQFQFNYAVATLGTFITCENIQTLFHTTDNVIYCYDGDAAGRSAAWRALELSLPYIKDNKNLKFMFLPEGEDPDSIIRKEGKKSFENRIKLATPMSQFLFNNLLNNADLSTLEEKSRVSSIVMPLINKIPGKTVRFFLQEQLSQKIGIINKFKFKKLFITYHNKIKKNQTIDVKHTTIRILIGLLVQNPWLAHTIPDILNISHLKIPGLSFFLELIRICIQHPHLNTGQLIELYRHSNRANIVKKIATWNHMIVSKAIANVFLDALTLICNKGLEARQEFLISKERITGLNKTEKIELWNINKELAKS